MSMDEIGRAINVEAQDNWIPIHPKLGVEYDQVLDDVVSQLKVGQIAKIATPGFIVRLIRVIAHRSRPPSSPKTAEKLYRI